MFNNRATLKPLLSLYHNKLESALVTVKDGSNARNDDVLPILDILAVDKNSLSERVQMTLSYLVLKFESTESYADIDYFEDLLSCLAFVFKSAEHTRCAQYFDQFGDMLDAFISIGSLPDYYSSVETDKVSESEITPLKLTLLLGLLDAIWEDYGPVFYFRIDEIKDDKVKPEYQRIAGICCVMIKGIQTKELSVFLGSSFAVQMFKMIDQADIFARAMYDKITLSAQLLNSFFDTCFKREVDMGKEMQTMCSLFVKYLKKQSSKNQDGRNYFPDSLIAQVLKLFFTLTSTDQTIRKYNLVTNKLNDIALDFVSNSKYSYECRKYAAQILLVYLRNSSTPSAHRKDLEKSFVYLIKANSISKSKVDFDTETCFMEGLLFVKQPNSSYLGEDSVLLSLCTAVNKCATNSLRQCDKTSTESWDKSIIATEYYISVFVRFLCYLLEGPTTIDQKLRAFSAGVHLIKQSSQENLPTAIKFLDFIHSNRNRLVVVYKHPVIFELVENCENNFKYSKSGPIVMQLNAVARFIRDIKQLWSISSSSSSQVVLDLFASYFSKGAFYNKLIDAIIKERSIDTKAKYLEIFKKLTRIDIFISSNVTEKILQLLNEVTTIILALEMLNDIVTNPDYLVSRCWISSVSVLAEDEVFFCKVYSLLTSKNLEIKEKSITFISNLFSALHSLQNGKVDQLCATCVEMDIIVIAVAPMLTSDVSMDLANILVHLCGCKETRSYVLQSGILSAKGSSFAIQGLQELTRQDPSAAIDFKDIVYRDRNGFVVKFEDVFSFPGIDNKEKENNQNENNMEDNKEREDKKKDKENNSKIGYREDQEKKYTNNLKDEKKSIAKDFEDEDIFRESKTGEPYETSKFASPINNSEEQGKDFGPEKVSRIHKILGFRKRKK